MSRWPYTHVFTFFWHSWRNYRRYNYRFLYYSNIPPSLLTLVIFSKIHIVMHLFIYRANVTVRPKSGSRERRMIFEQYAYTPRGNGMHSISIEVVSRTSSNGWTKNTCITLFRRKNRPRRTANYILIMSSLSSITRPRIIHTSKFLSTLLSTSFYRSN